MKACPACNSRYDDVITFCSKDGTPVVTDLSAPKAADAMIGQVIAGRYKIVKKLGEGGMGEVYVAEHVHIDKIVALKLLRAEVLSNKEAVIRFQQEARSSSSIKHSNIIQIEDFGELPDGRVYMAMEFLEGAALNDMITKGALDLGRALNILIQTCQGLEAAHAKGITHRDMKPENIYVTNTNGHDVPKILDFGIAKVSGGDTSAQNLTQAGTIYGTPFYMAPEQAMGHKMDHRIDIYAMGIILYEVFCGTVPFKAETFMGILAQHITMDAVPPSQQARTIGRIVQPELENVIMKAIAKDPSGRYQSMGELAAALTEVYRMYVGPRSTGAMQAQTAPFPQYSTANYPRHTTGPGPAFTAVGAPAAGKKKGSLMPVFAVIGIVAIGGGVAGWYFVAGPGKAVAVKDPQPPVVSTPSSAPAATVAAVSSAPAASTASSAPAVVTTSSNVVAISIDAGHPLVAADPIDHPPDPRNNKDPKKDPKKDPRNKPALVVTTSQATVVPVVEPKTVVVMIDFQPDGADIYRGGTKVGETPSNVELKEGETASFVIKKEGYKDGSATWKAGSPLKVKGRLQKIRDESGDEELKGFPDKTPKTGTDDDGLAKPKGM